MYNGIKNTISLYGADREATPPAMPLLPRQPMRVVILYQHLETKR